MSIWRELGIRRTRERAAIEDAYARRCAHIDAAANPACAAALRAARARALRFCAAMDGGAVPFIGASVPPPQPRAPLPPPGRGRGRAGGPARATEVASALSGLVERLLTPLRRGDQRMASGALRGVLRDPLLNNRALRGAFERRLLSEIALLDDCPVDFALAVVAAFRLNEGRGHLPAREGGVAARLCRIAEGEHHVAALRRAARRWAFWFPFSRRPFAAALITGAFRPRLFRLVALDPLTVRAVRRLLDELRGRYPWVVTRKLDPKVLAWWEGVLGAGKVATARPGRAA